MLHSMMTLLSAATGTGAVTTAVTTGAAEGAGSGAGFPIEVLLGIAIGLGLFCILLQFMHIRRYHSEADAEEPNDTPAPATPGPGSASSAPTAPKIDDGALVAAITAAIAAMREEEGNTAGFRVVSFKRAPSGKNRF